MIGWGKKRSSESARAYAAQHGLPYIALEDGFLRSAGLGGEGIPPLSIVMDRSGIYYDARQSSDLEKNIEAGHFDSATLQRARDAMTAIREEKLTKYNKDNAPLVLSHPIKRLIIDQTAGDASVLLSGAGDAAFDDMIRDALSHFDAGDIAVKLHPDTMHGLKGGYLKDLSARYGLRLIDQPVNPWELLDHTEEVATISSQFGFDALMAGKKVICYGLPFYAGWGLTEDKIAAPRRTRNADVTEVFAAAYIDYARYIDPSGDASTLENTIDLLSDTKRMMQKTQKNASAIGFSPWKQWFLPRFTGGRKHIHFKYCATPGKPVMAWASRRDEWLLKRGITKSSLFIRVEDGFIRSRGLGAKLTRPWSLVMDETGIYYDPRQPSDLEQMLETAPMPERLLRRAEKLRKTLVAQQISKYNTGLPNGFSIDAGSRPVILVPGQVEDDASIRTGTRDIKTNLGLLETVRAARPDAYITYKPHPDVEAGKRRGAIPPHIMRQYCDQVIEHVSIAALWPFIDEVHTLTSLAGFEALLRDKKVYCYGIPFYAGWGLTQDYYKTERRNRVLTINMLVAATLIMYPVYIDWQTKTYSTVETIIRRLARHKK